MQKRDIEIVIADHDARSAHEISVLLASSGYPAAKLVDQTNALREIIANRACDMLFLDAALDSKNGDNLSLATSLQKASPHLKIIVMLNTANRLLPIDAAGNGKLRFLLKPIMQKRNIVRMVEACLEDERSDSGLLMAKKYSEFISARPDISGILQKLVDDVVKNLGYEICTVILRREDDPQSLYVAAVRGMSQKPHKNFNLRVGEGITGKVIANGLPLVVPNIFGEADYRYHGFAIKENLCSMVSIPLRHDNATYGALNVYTGAGYFHAFTENEINLLSALANWTALAIFNTDKYETRKREQVKLVDEIVRETQATDSLEKMVKAVLQRITALVGGETSYVAFVDHEAMRFWPVHAHRRKLNQDNLERLIIGSPGEGIAGHVVRVGEAEIIDDVVKDKRHVVVQADAQFRSKVIVPLKYSKHVIGVLSVDSERPSNFKEADKQILEVLASHLALIFQKQKLGLAFKNLGYSFRASHNLKEIYNTVIARASEVIGAKAVALWEKDSDGRFTMRASSGVEKIKSNGLRIAPNEGIIGQVIESRDIVLIKDVTQNDRYKCPELIAGAQFKWLLCVPLFFGNEVFGVLDVYTRRPHGFFEQEIDYLKALTNQAGVAIENAKLIEHFNKIAQAITSSQGIKKTLESIAQSALEVLCADPVTLFLYDQSSRKPLPPKMYAGILYAEREYVDSFVFNGRTFPELILARGNSLYIEDIERHPLMIEAKRHLREGMPQRRFHEREKIKSTAALVLKAEEETIGVMFLNYRTRQSFSEIEKKIMETFASHAAIAIKNSRLIEELRTNKEFLENIIERSPDPIIVTENRTEDNAPAWKIQLANRAAHEMHGYDFQEKELHGKNAGELFGGEFDHLRQALRENRGEISNFETSFLHKSGHPMPISLSISILQEDNAKRLNKTIGIAKDLTYRKELEKQLDQLSRATISLLNAASLDEAYDSICSNLRQIGYDKGMISLVDESKKTLVDQHAFGENWKKIVGASPRPLQGDDILALVVRSGRAQLIEDCSHHPQFDQSIFQSAGIKSLYITPLIGQDNVIGTLQIDLSDKQELLKGDKYFRGESLNILSVFANQIAVAIEANRRKITIDKLRLTLADVGHEFRSPLHIIISQLGGLRYHLEKNYPEDARVKKTAKIVEEEAYRAARQMNNSLFSNVESLEALGVNFEEGFIGKTIQLCSDRFQESADKRGIRIVVYDSVKKLPGLHFDRSQMEQVFTNLFDNAVKYSHAHQQIEVRGMDLGKKVEISVLDRGLGIPENQYEKIFQGFTRSEVLDTSRYIPGTGLGLMIAKEIVERHHGKIRVKSVPFFDDPKRRMNYEGYDTTFYVTLPYNPREV